MDDGIKERTWKNVGLTPLGPLSTQGILAAIRAMAALTKYRPQRRALIAILVAILATAATKVLRRRKSTAGQVETAGTSYDLLIKEELEHERARKDSLEQRGFAVITSSGAIVAVLFALTAVASGKSKLDLDPASTLLIIGGGFLFATAAALGIWVNRPTTYRQAQIDWLATLTLPDYWSSSPDLGGRRAAESRVERIRDARERNERKSRVLRAAVTAQALGIIAVGAAAIALIVQL